jgi:hypothetical protein
MIVEECMYLFIYLFSRDLERNDVNVGCVLINLFYNVCCSLI